MRYHPRRNNESDHEKIVCTLSRVFFFRRIIFLSYTDDSALPFFAFFSFQRTVRRVIVRDGEGKWTRVFLRTALSEGFKGRTKIRPFPTADRANGGGDTSSQSLSYIWEFRRIGFCLTYAQWAARILALSRMAIICNPKSVSEIRDFSSTEIPVPPGTSFEWEKIRDHRCARNIRINDNVSYVVKAAMLDPLVLRLRRRDDYAVKKLRKSS